MDSRDIIRKRLVTKLLAKKYRDCIKIIENQDNNCLEVDNILNQINGYEYTSNKDKIEKHFAGHYYVSFDDFNKSINKSHKKKQTRSCSLSRKPLLEQFSELLIESKKDQNMLNMFKDNKLCLEKTIYNNYLIKNSPPPDNKKQCLSPSNIDGIQIYNKEAIKRDFPQFYDELEKRFHYDKIYTFNTNNIKYYDVKNKNPCDTVLICCQAEKAGKTLFHIFFELKNNPHNRKHILGDDLMKYLFTGESQCIANKSGCSSHDPFARDKKEFNKQNNLSF